MLLGMYAFAEHFPIVYTGTWLSYPVVVVEGPSDGFMIQNISTGLKVQMDYYISEGETVTLNMEYGNKTIFNQLGTNLIGTLTNDSDFAGFHIAPHPEVANGVNNIFVIAGVENNPNTNVTISYYTRHIGI
jgi:hypothetical protein